MSKNNKIIVSVGLGIIITLLAISCTTNNYYPLQREDYQMFKATYIPRDTVCRPNNSRHNNRSRINTMNKFLMAAVIITAVIVILSYYGGDDNQAGFQS